MNNPLITLTPRVFTDAGVPVFLKNYSNIPQDRQIVLFNHEQTWFIDSSMAALRRHDRPTSTPFTQESEGNGIAAELAAMRYMAIPPETAMALFLNGLGGDQGWDFCIQRWGVDVKSTVNAEGIFTFSRKVATASPAQIMLFVKVRRVGKTLETNLTGWAWTAEVKPWIRLHGGRYRVRLWVLKREGVLRPMAELKAMAGQVSQ
jgi:hypothetical protein